MYFQFKIEALRSSVLLLKEPSVFLGHCERVVTELRQVYLAVEQGTEKTSQISSLSFVETSRPLL